MATDWKACTGVVDEGGKFLPDVPTALIEDFAQFKGKLVELQYRPLKSTRSNRQNRAWWGIVVAEFMKKTGVKERRVMHEWILDQIHHVEIVVIMGVEKRKLLPTHNLSRGKFSALYKKAQDLGSRLGIEIPDPEADEESRKTLNGMAAWY